MYVLGIDTSSQSCGASIADENSILAEINLVPNASHSSHIFKVIETVFELTGIKMPDIACFAVTKGPGAFTGLRVGISIVKGFCTALNKPATGVSSLKALALQVSACKQPLICPMLDARKNEVYCSVCKAYKQNCTETIFPETVIKPADILEKLQKINQPCLFIGSGALSYKELILETLGTKAFFVPNHENIIRSSSVARLGISKIINNDTDTPQSLLPFYIRESDAVLK